jgi:hypothetical protein
VDEVQLRKLLSLCTRVLKASELVDGEVTNGYRFENGKKVPIVEQGKVIKDAAVARSADAKRLLLRQHGLRSVLP